MTHFSIQSDNILPAYSDVDINNTGMYSIPSVPFDPSVPPPPFGVYPSQQYHMPHFPMEQQMGQMVYYSDNMQNPSRGYEQPHQRNFRNGRGQGYFHKTNGRDVAIGNAMDDYLQDFKNLEYGDDKEKREKDQENINLSSKGLQSSPNFWQTDNYKDIHVGGSDVSDHYSHLDKSNYKFNRGRGRGRGSSQYRYTAHDKYQQKPVDTSNLHMSVKSKIKDRKFSEKNESNKDEMSKLDEAIGDIDKEVDLHGNSMDHRGESYNMKTKVEQRGQRYIKSGSAPMSRPFSGRQYQNTNKSYRGRQFGSNYDPQNDTYNSRGSYSGRPLDDHQSKNRNNSSKDDNRERGMVNLKTVMDGNRKQKFDSKSGTNDNGEDLEERDCSSSQSDKNVKSNHEKYKMSRNYSGSKGQNYRPGVTRTLSGKVDESQRGLLIDQLTNGTYECMVCFDTIRGQNAVWSCSSCYHVFHLRCIKKWARSSTVNSKEDGWRCPACQNLCEKLPWQYWCFCGKLRDPEWHRMEIPHSCGEVCRKSRGDNCPHKCNILCHPGPCPPCSAMIKRSCDCGKTSQTMKCCVLDKVKCDKVCNKALNCGKHFCKVTCHGGSCLPCSEIVSQVCYKGHKKRDVICGSKESFEDSFSCGASCNKILACGNHTCEETCHQGDCQHCALSPNVVTTCPCGGTLLTDISTTPRKSCLDPVATCDSVCGRSLTCGPPGNAHTCKEKCHMGPCGPCDGQTLLRCRCGAFEKEFFCKEVQEFTDENQFCCDKRCNKKRSCGKHKCGQLCCVKEEHSCDLICGKKLSCGLHKCDEPCHRGNCPPCLLASFDELSCYCGAEVMFPPIPCGTKPPECHRKCTKTHACDHPVRHNCNSDPECPPCTELTTKYCMGNHELRKNIPCHITNISCGLPCNKALPCQQHFCIKVCHKGECQEDGETCIQPCNIPRPLCGHICGVPCHSGTSCPFTTCKAEIVVRCACGRKEAKVPCLQGGNSSGEISEYQKIAVQNIAGFGQPLDMTQFTSLKQSRKQLECDETCAKMERNRNLAIALQIKNPDLSTKPGPPPYTDFLKDYAKNNPHNVAAIEKTFAELVHNAQTSKFPHRSHSFPSMRIDQRKVIHELAEFYGFKTQSYDFEPKKNVVATAYKGKCWLPHVTLTALVQRELHPKAPTPIPHVHSEDAIRKTAAAAKQSTEVLGEKKSVYLKPSRETTTDNKRLPKTEKVIDYFDFSED